jgi:hypothetical protein
MMDEQPATQSASGGSLVDTVPKKPLRPLPDDLPTSLNDRKRVHDELVPETEIYDAWQGQEYLTIPSWDTRILIYEHRPITVSDCANFGEAP